MENREFWRLEGVSDAGLQTELMQLLASGHRTEARIVAHIAEVDRRKLFLEEGFSALYKYCQQRLGLSEYEAWHRMTAARLARRFPLVFTLIEQRKLHLSGLCVLRKFLTPENHRDLLLAACERPSCKSKTSWLRGFQARKGAIRYAGYPRGAFSLQ